VGGGVKGTAGGGALEALPVELREGAIWLVG